MLSSMTFYSWRGISIYFIQEILIVSFYKTFFFTNHCTNKMLQQYFNNLIQCIFNFLKVTQKSLSSTHTHTQTHTHTHTHRGVTYVASSCKSPHSLSFYFHNELLNNSGMWCSVHAVFGECYRLFRHDQKACTFRGDLRKQQSRKHEIAARASREQGWQVLIIYTGLDKRHYALNAVNSFFVKPQGWHCMVRRSNISLAWC